MGKKKFDDLRDIRELRNKKKLNDGKGWIKNLGVKQDEVQIDVRRPDSNER